MAKNLIPEELDALIKEYLTDGVLTDKERQVILKKAEGMGLDRDEIDLYLDAQVQKIDQATDMAIRKQKGKTCPYCGGNIPQLTDKCPHCNNIITAQANEDLQEIFDNLEEALVNMKAGKDFMHSKASVERYTRKAKMYYGNNPKVQILLEEIEDEMTKTEKTAKSKAKKQGFVSFISNKWVWVLIELIVIGILYTNAIHGINDAKKELEELTIHEKELEQQRVDNRMKWGDLIVNDKDKINSEEYEQRNSEFKAVSDSLELAKSQCKMKWRAAQERTESHTHIFIILIGIVIVGITTILAIKDKKRQ